MKEHDIERLHARNNQVHLSFSNIMLVFVLFFLFIPLIVVVTYSFNETKEMNFTGFTLQWYKKLFTDSSALWAAFTNSLLVAMLSSITATILGSMAAIGIKWYQFKARKAIISVSYLPMVLPEVIVGVSMLIFFSSLNINLGLFTIYIAHTTFNLPFVFLLVSARLDEFDYSTIEAARDLGATETQSLFKVVIPSILPGILSGLLMSVTMSLEDFVITFFVTGAGSDTLPLYVYSQIRYGVSPVINALSMIVILGTMALAWVCKSFLKTIAANS